VYRGKNTQQRNIPWEEYPRPQMRRDSYLCLNGTWELAVTRGDVSPVYDRTVLVPFPPPSPLSGISESFTDEDVLWYRRSFRLPAGFVRCRVILHIGAADQCAAVWVNGVPVGEHRGGYAGFCMDITDALAGDGGENTLLVRVEDRLDSCILPYGKQRRKRGGMWYTPVCGIWQSVWLESVPETYVRTLQITSLADGAILDVTGVTEGTVLVETEAGTVPFPLRDGTARVTLPDARLWSPEDPWLYSFTLRAGEDEVRSYFACRTLEIREVGGYARLCLNGKPYFFHGVLDQGYFRDGIFTPASPEAYTRDILAMKKLGFNMLRKHIKVEPPCFYYDCDRLGMVVFQDMVNNGDYSFLRDTALPTVGLQKRSDRRMHRDPATREAFVSGMRETVQALRNHPSVCLWTVFNEGWGQFSSTEIYRLLRKLDPSRFIDTASGWFSGGETDVDSRHVYFRRVQLKPSDRPLFLSEFGGYTFAAEGHVFRQGREYGYGKYTERQDFVRALRRLYTEEILPLVSRGLCAAVYTQLSDVEDEINGLLTYDREVEKVLPEEFRDVSAALCAGNGRPGPSTEETE